MGIIKKKLWVYGSIGKRECEVLFDTGASASFVRKDIASKIGIVVNSPFTQTFRLGNNTKLTAQKTIDLFVNIKEHKISFYFLVIPDLPYEVIIGADFLQRWKIKLDPATEDFIIDEKAFEMILV